MNKVFVVGLDGVGFPVIDPWIAAGELPHLREYVQAGTIGELRSVIPPLTGPAWSSFQTGVNPGKHGIFGWTKQKPGGYGFRVVDSRDIAVPTVWELASAQGRKVISIGIPVTYPPRVVNGVIVPGMLTPRSDPAPTYPKAAYAELRRAAPGYRFFPECAHRFTVRAKVEELLTSARGRAAAARYFMTNHDWDLFVLHLQTTDKAQHDLWGMVRNGVDPVLTVFREVDRLVGELVETARGMGATVVFISDHGMGPEEYTFSVNTWLWQEGYLQLRGGLGGRLKRAMFRAGFTQRRLMSLGLALYPFAYRLGLANSFVDAVGDSVIARAIGALFLSFSDIDWGRTRAYSRADIGHVIVNLRGREPHGIVPEAERDSLVDELIEGLNSVVNPDTGEPLLGEAYRREEVYSGPHLEEAPDIMFIPKDLRTIATGASGFYSNRLFDRPLLRANHRMDGIMIGMGEPFQAGTRIEGAQLIDLAPNLLYLLGCEIPRYMDGRLWDDAYLQGYVTAHPPRFSDLDLPGGAATVEASAADEEELKRRLRGLGYLS